MTLQEAIDNFTTYLEGAGRSQRTVEGYCGRLRRFMMYPEVKPDMALDGFTPELLDRWAAGLRESHTLYEGNHYRQQVERQLSPHSIAGYIQAVKTLFKFCHDRGYLTRNPAFHLKKPALRYGFQTRSMNRSDLYRMLDVAHQKAINGEPRDLAILMFMADTGARRGEVSSLTISNLMLDRLDAWVEGKTGGDWVDFTEATAVILRYWLIVRPACDHDFVFIGDGLKNQGGPLLPGAIYLIFKRLAKKAGVRGRWNPHSVRHLVGQAWADVVNLELVRQKLRHTSIETTALYANQDRTRVKAATTLYSPLTGYQVGIDLAAEVFGRVGGSYSEDGE